MFFHSHANITHFHKKGCALGLILKVRVFGTRKWPIVLVVFGVRKRTIGDFSSEHLLHYAIKTLFKTMKTISCSAAYTRFGQIRECPFLKPPPPESDPLTCQSLGVHMVQIVLTRSLYNISTYSFVMFLYFWNNAAGIWEKLLFDKSLQSELKEKVVK